MNECQYRKVREYFTEHETARCILILFNDWITRIVYITYLVMCAGCAYEKDHRVIFLVITCGVSFIVVSIFRNIVDMPRPYERYALPPIIPKDTHGHSFPSRHVFSIFVIATTISYIVPALGIALFVAGILLAAARVLGGVHFIIDVAAGAFIGILSGVIGAFIFL